MNVIRETVRVATEEISKGGKDKYPNLKYSPTGEIGQTTVSEFLGGPWKYEYQILLIKEALAQIHDIEEEIVEEEHLQKLPSFRKSQAVRKAVKKTWRVAFLICLRRFNMPYPDEYIFFYSELLPLLEPIAKKCEAAGYAFIAGIKGPTIPGTVMNTWDPNEITSYEQRQSIFSRLADPPFVQNRVQQCEE